jgi:membrane protein
MDFAGVRARFERSIAGEIVDELVRIEVIDRSLALASKLFVAVIPLSIIVKAVAPGSGNFGEDLVRRLGLSGPGASATRTLFATGSDVRAAVSVIGLLILLYSMLSFTRALQRVYLNIWRLRPQLPDALLRQARWIVGFIAYTVVLSPLRDLEHRHDVGALYAPSVIAFGAAFWLWTPHVLLGKRVSWRRLMPTALLTTVGIVLFSVGTAVLLPSIITNNAQRYGLIGVAFGLVTWLFAYSAVVTVSAVVGGTLARRLPGAENGDGPIEDGERPSQSPRVGGGSP